MHRWLALLLSSALLSVGGCGGGGGGGGSTPPPAVENTQPIIVDPGPANNIDLPFTSVTVCAPGASTNCQTIDHILVDTGSSGLRIMSSVLSPALALRQQTDAAGNPLAACAQFVDGFSWGSVKVADVRLAGEQANSLSIHVIGDPAFALIPASCSSAGPPENTVDAFGANGVLGIGTFVQDCGNACAIAAIPGAYYHCPAAGCQPTALALAQQVTNPVALFASDNNGVIVVLPSVTAIGAATASGSLIFGIGTQGNNGLGGATVLAVDPGTGNLATIFNNQSYGGSYLDTGTNAIVFGNGVYPTCTGPARGFYCPASTQNLAATLRGSNGATTAVSFSVANADLLVANNPGYAAFGNLAAPNADATSFVWGLPFHFGRRVYTAIEGRNAGGGTGPFIAF